MVTQTNIHKVCCKNCAIKKMFVCIFTRNLFKAATECSQPPLQRYGVFGDHWKLPNPAKDLAKETLPDISSCNWNQITGNSMMRPTTLLCSHMAYAWRTEKLRNGANIHIPRQQERPAQRANAARAMRTWFLATSLIVFFMFNYFTFSMIAFECQI